MVNSVTTNTASAMTTVSPPTTSSSKTSSNDLANLDQNTFMKLLLTQVKNQDPINPMDSAQFMGQLAQLASVQGIQQLNQSVDQFSKYMEQNRALQAASLVGREAMVSGNSITSSDGSLTGVVRIPQGATAAEVAIKDSAGNVVSAVIVPSGSIVVLPEETSENGAAEARAREYAKTMRFAASPAAAMFGQIIFN